MYYILAISPPEGGAAPPRGKTLLREGSPVGIVWLDWNIQLASVIRPVMVAISTLKRAFLLERRIIVPCRTADKRNRSGFEDRRAEGRG
jgi:hypothetical protein